MKRTIRHAFATDFGHFFAAAVAAVGPAKQLQFRASTPRELPSEFGFYRAMLCIRGTSHGPVAVRVCLSVTSRVLLKRLNVGS